MFLTKLTAGVLSRSLVLLTLTFGAGAHAQSSRADTIRGKLLDPERGVFVVAHRGCHNPAPSKKLLSAPENSLVAMDHCVVLGVDMMELDVRRTKDGALVILHDETVDRTTDGHGPLAGLTLAKLKQLHLRENLGGNVYPTPTSHAMPTLAEALRHAKGRIMLNLDIKEDIYREVVEAVLAMGMGDYVLIKKVVAREAAPLVDQAPYDKVPFMPILGNWPDDPTAGDLATIASQQLDSKRRAAGVELVFLTPEQFVSVRHAAKARKVRLWSNTLASVIGVIGAGSDIDAMRTQGKTWGDMIGQGIDTFQTDEPGPLIEYLKSHKIRH